MVVWWGIRDESISVAIFVVVRYFNGYGNMWLYREGDSIVQWLHVSNYPPSLSYFTLEVGLMCLLTAAFMEMEKRVQVNPNGVLLFFGQKAMFL